MQRRRRPTPLHRAQHHHSRAARETPARLKTSQIQASTADRLTRSRGHFWTPIGGPCCVLLDNKTMTATAKNLMSGIRTVPDLQSNANGPGWATVIDASFPICRLAARWQPATSPAVSQSTSEVESVRMPSSRTEGNSVAHRTPKRRTPEWACGAPARYWPRRKAHQHRGVGSNGYPQWMRRHSLDASDAPVGGADHSPALSAHRIARASACT